MLCCQDIFAVRLALAGTSFHLSTYHSTYIYGGKVGLICITLSVVGLPGVNLIIYKDDLRMMG